MRRILAWFKAGIREAFYGRRARRARCACQHPWCNHNARGCMGTINDMRPYPCSCALNRDGKPARKALWAVGQ